VRARGVYAGSALCGMAPNIEALQISRVVQGVGAALLLTNSLAALNNAFADPLRRSKAIAAWASAGALGVALGPVLGGLLVQALGWRSIFIVNIPVGLIALLLPLTLALGIGTRAGAVVLRNYGPFHALIQGHFAAALGALILASFGQELTPATLALPLVVVGAGAGITTPAMNLVVLDSVERTQGGLASGVLNSARQTGGVIGVALLGTLLGEPVTSAGGQAAEYVAACVLCLASGLALAASKNWHPTRGADRSEP
jgi:predicted MFS family arabinose efflux permease